MALSSLSVALQGLGFDSRHLALQGLVDFEEPSAQVVVVRLSSRVVGNLSLESVLSTAPQLSSGVARFISLAAPVSGNVRLSSKVVTMGTSGTMPDFSMEFSLEFES